VKEEREKEKIYGGFDTPETSGFLILRKNTQPPYNASKIATKL